MKTFVVIGSDKDAGKTTVLTFIYRQLLGFRAPSAICLSATGVSGTAEAPFSQEVKPTIRLAAQTHFITHWRHLSRYDGAYTVIRTLSPPDFRENYIVGRTRKAMPLVLEGPNTKEEILNLQHQLKTLLPSGVLLLDGATDRQFLGHPNLCDGFYFAILVSNRRSQRQKAMNLLTPLTFPCCSPAMKTRIAKRGDAFTKSLLLEQTPDAEPQLIYRGKTPPTTDRELQSLCFNTNQKKCILYLNGALTPALWERLHPLTHLSLILDNFTQYQTFASHVPARPGSAARGSQAALEVSLLHPVQVNLIFIKAEEKAAALPLPPGIRTVNLYREDPHEIGTCAGRAF